MDFGRGVAWSVAPSEKQFLPPFPRIKCGAPAQPAPRAGLPPKGAHPGSRPGQAYQAPVPPHLCPHTSPRWAVAARIVDTYRTHPADTSGRVCAVLREKRLQLARASILGHAGKRVLREQRLSRLSGISPMIHVDRKAHSRDSAKAFAGMTFLFLRFWNDGVHAKTRLITGHSANCCVHLIISKHNRSYCGCTPSTRKKRTNP